MPARAFAPICRDVDLAHPRIEASLHLRRAVRAPRGLRDRFQRRDRQERDVRAQRESLRYPAGDAHAGERARPRAERDGVEVGQRPTGFRERRVDQRQEPRRMRLSGELRVLGPAPVLAAGDGEPLCGRVEGQELHSANITGRRGRDRLPRTICAGAPPPRRIFRNPAIAPAHEVVIESLDQEGRGVAHVDGKAMFVEGALPGERVEVLTLKDKPGFTLARVTQVLRASSSRVVPRCPHFGVCGGCTLQHAHPSLQVAAKQRALEDALARIGRVRPDVVLPAIEGPAWRYRYRARLSVRHVAKKGGVLIGFHERRSTFVADMRECHVLPLKLSVLLPALRELVGALSVRDRLPQIEVAVGEHDGGLIYALVLRILEPLSAADEAALLAFEDANGVEFWLQSGGPGTVVPLRPGATPLAYALPESSITMPFGPTEFTQVNYPMNRVLVRRALALLAPQAGERVADYFCGLGNFTLPIARRAAEVLGIEGSAPLVRRAAENAAANGLGARARFAVANLFAATPESVAAFGLFHRALIDPPREGAVELVKSFPRRDEPGGLARIVYVSCAPGTLARDASVLVHDRGYRLAAAGVVNMFPHTAHVESIAVFE
jgi:23S rRNA (uracil1939-C5)-methyltransferase